MVVHKVCYYLFIFTSFVAIVNLIFTVYLLVFNQTIVVNYTHDMADLPFHSQFQWNRILRGRSGSAPYNTTGTLHKNIRENFGENISNSTRTFPNLHAQQLKPGKKNSKRIAKNISNNYVENKITPEKGYASITMKKIKRKCVMFRTTSACDPNGKRLPGKDLGCRVEIPQHVSGYCECESGRKAKESSCKHLVFTCEDACNKTPTINESFAGKCIAFRTTMGCRPDGKRVPNLDKTCTYKIHNGLSGYCECENKRNGKGFSCNHQEEEYTCDDICAGKKIIKRSFYKGPLTTVKPMIYKPEIPNDMRKKMEEVILVKYKDVMQKNPPKMVSIAEKLHPDISYRSV